MKPIFVGGTGRSGTTILGQLIGEHADVAHVMPTEVRFFTARRGLIDVLNVSEAAARRSPLRRVFARRRPSNPEVTPEEFAEQLRTHWYGWTGSDGIVRGLHLGGIELATIDAALEGFEARMQADPLTGARRLAEDIMTALAGGSPSWVETSPANAVRARGLSKLFPDMWLVHVIRDGRDAAASIATMSWGPNDIFEALDWWAVRMNLAYAALETFPKDRLLTIRLEDLVLHDREGTFERICPALELAPDDAMRAFFDQKLTRDKLHLGRWRSQLSGDEVIRFDERYRVRLMELRERFGPVPPTEDLDQPPYEHADGLVTVASTRSGGGRLSD